MIENKFIILQYIQKQKQMLRNMLILFGNTRGSYVKYLKAIAAQRKQKLPTSL